MFALIVLRACSRLVRKMSADLTIPTIRSSSTNTQSVEDVPCTGVTNNQSNEQELYENAVKMLNTVQLQHANYHDNKSYFQLAEKFAELGNLPVKELNKLAAIHVSGTKGKGSVCAFCESILRHTGYKTGFYSSPHIMEVRERIRINGRPISKKMFTRYFWECWNNYQKSDFGLPSYKMFMTFMSFHVFLKEKVDVAIVEVGLGGEYDATNVLRKPYVCGVSLLEKDHLESLGGSVESIAWHKSGIFKCGVPAFTLPQDPVSLKVLAERAREKKTPLNIVPDISTFPNEKLPVLGIEGSHQFQNASLASYLCQAWLQQKNLEIPPANLGQNISSPEMAIPIANVFGIPDTFKEGLSNAYWPGRSHCIERPNITFYIDGAHTRKSIEACASWFRAKANEEMNKKRPQQVARILIFNLKGKRDSESLLEPLLTCNFDFVVFCPNLLSVERLPQKSDIVHLNANVEFERQHCYEIQDTWKQLLQNYQSTPGSDKTPKIQTLVENSRVFSCVTDAVHWSVNNRDPSIICPRPLSPLPSFISRANHVQILVTGSLYLSGLVMKVLGPNIVQI